MSKIAKNALVGLFFGFFVFQANAQEATNLSVSLSDSVYQLLEYASLRGIIPLLPNEKPYTQKFVIEQLDKIIESGELSETDIEIYTATRNRILPSEKQKWYVYGGYTNFYESAEENSETKKETELPVFVKTDFLLDFNINCNQPDLSREYWHEIFFGGNISEYFSYLLNFSYGLQNLATVAYPKNSYTKSWDGFQMPLDNVYDYAAINESLSIGFRMCPELVFSYNDIVDVKFSRTKRQWGYGTNSLYLSDTAGPFVALETKIQPLSWLKTNFLFGSLEYENDASLKANSLIFQNLYAIVTGEINFNWFYGGIITSAVLPKRFELGYLNSLSFPVLAQNNYGDFDNVQGGMYLGTRIPKIGHIYASIFVDEINTSVSFAHLDRNMFCYQAGMKSPVPLWNSIITLQYTKIEPYMYTHPLTKTPWYPQDMEMSYINHGHCLGYNLEPNSDEIRLEMGSLPLWFLKANLSYALTRHGATKGSKAVDGSSFSDTLDYSGNLQGAQEGDLYWKDFLHDGAYEWIHSVSLGASLDCKKWNVPIEIGIAYTFCYTHYSYGTATSFEFFSDDEYKNEIANYLTLCVKVY